MQSLLNTNLVQLVMRFLIALVLVIPKYLIATYLFVFQVNYVLNTLLSLNMVIAFLVALILDNTVPGGRQERGLYVWSEAEAASRESAFMKDYELPFKLGRPFRWAKCVGL